MKIAQLVLFWGLWYLAFTTRSLISPFLPIIESEFAINHATAGGLLFFAAAGGTTALALTGRLSTWIGYKRLITASFLLSAAALAGLFYAPTYPAFAISLFCFGVGGGFYLPCAIPILTEVFTREHWGKVFSVHETAAGFSMLSVPLLVSILVVLTVASGVSALGLSVAQSQWLLAVMLILQGTFCVVFFQRVLWPSPN